MTSGGQRQQGERGRVLRGWAPEKKGERNPKPRMQRRKWLAQLPYNLKAYYSSNAVHGNDFAQADLTKDRMDVELVEKVHL